MVADESTWPRWFQRIAQQNEELTALPAMAGNDATLYGDYQASIDAMAAEIDRAEWVHVEFFIVAWDDTTREFFSAMERAVARGVSVRLLADHISSRKLAHAKETFAELDRIGVKWAWMLPVMPFKGKYQRPDLRNHRKIVVVDGVVAFMGSQNLISRDYDSEKNIKRGLKWQELVTRLTGPVVASVNAVFLSDWLIETERISSTPSMFPSESRRARAGRAGLPGGAVGSRLSDREQPAAVPLAHLRRHREGHPHQPVLRARRGDGLRDHHRLPAGLEVQLFVSEIGDQGLVYHAQRSYYDALLEAGVKIFLYPAPFILHSKHFSIDDNIAVIGSSNMDIRSFSLNMEVSLLVLGSRSSPACAKWSRATGMPAASSPSRNGNGNPRRPPSWTARPRLTATVRSRTPAPSTIRLRIIWIVTSIRAGWLAALMSPKPTVEKIVTVRYSASTRVRGSAVKLCGVERHQEIRHGEQQKIERRDDRQCLDSAQPRLWRPHDGADLPDRTASRIRVR